LRVLLGVVNEFEGHGLAPLAVEDDGLIIHSQAHQICK